MATRDSRGMGIAHLTVVPENLDPESSSETGGDDTAIEDTSGE